MNNTVIITGASAGIGKALAYEFAEHNYDLFLVARSEDKLERVHIKRASKIIANMMTDRKMESSLS